MSLKNGLIYIVSELKMSIRNMEEILFDDR